MNPASPAQYLVRELLVRVWPPLVWPPLVWPPLVWPVDVGMVYMWPVDVGLVDVGLGRVPAAGVSRSTQINQPLL
jgi:hypothetical protein